MRKPKKCLWPGCTEPVVAKTEEGNWICRPHIDEMTYSPEASLVANEAQQQLSEFVEAGGVLS